MALVATLLFVSTCAAVSFSWIYGSHLAEGPPIRSDGTGYYLYLPAVILDRDVTMQRTAQRSFGGRTRELQVVGVHRVPPYNRYLDKYPIGEAMMLIPFFLVGDVAAHLTDAANNGFSKPYQLAAAAGGFVYALLGLALLAFVLFRWFSRATVTLTLLAITFGTALFHYATYDAVLSHAFSFFLVAIILRLALSVYKGPRLRDVILLGLASGLLVAVRPTNAVFLLFVSMLGVSTIGELKQRLTAPLRHARLFAAGFGAGVIPLLPQVAYWHKITGSFYVYTYGNEHLDLLHPHLLEVLFSVRKGLFFWAPLLLLSLIGLPLLSRYARGIVIPAAVYLSINTWVIASWSTWWYGGSLGQRPFVEALPIFALGLAALIETVRGPIGRPVLMAGIAASTLLATHAMVAYWLQWIPIDHTTWRIYASSFRMG
jgi:hypothetical protein